MKARLVFQEGPGSGGSYPLDPYSKTLLSIGRSSRCDITVTDHRASRHHCDIRWNGYQWEVADRGSTNGTFVNGMQIQRPRGLRLNDRVSMGETTMVLRELSQQQVISSGPQAAAAPAAEGRVHTSPGTAVAVWLARGLIGAAVVCLAAGAFLPWLRISGSLSQELEPLVQGIANIVAMLSGSESIFNITQDISGLEGYGKLTLGIAIVSGMALVMEVFFYRRSAVPAIVYLMSGLIAAGAIGLDLISYYRFYNGLRDLNLLFGIQLEEVVQVFNEFIEFQVTPMVGLALTGAGLVILIVGGLIRLVQALLDRGSQ
jgi:hypothetical protein